MTGQAADTPARVVPTATPAPRPQPAQPAVAARQQPQVARPEPAARPREEAEDARDRIEIPAFLRRQAN